jgi:hypothetical protein
LRRNGTVAAMNAARGMVAIATEDDSFTIIELLSDWELHIGDAISWENGYGMGSEVYENLTRQTRSEVYVQNHAVHQSTLRQQLLL